MKFIVASDFRKTTDAIVILDKESIKHDLHVHKGATITIGGEAALEDMRPTDVKLCADLNAAGRIVAFDDEKSVKKIRAEIAALEKKEKAAAESPKK